MGKLLSCGHQFKGILLVLNPKTNEHDSDLFLERKESKKKKFDTKGSYQYCLLGVM